MQGRDKEAAVAVDKWLSAQGKQQSLSRFSQACNRMVEQ